MIPPPVHVHVLVHVKSNLAGDGIPPIEIKYGIKTDTRRLAALKRFVKERDLPLGIVVNNADTPELTADRIVHLPVQYR